MKRLFSSNVGERVNRSRAGTMLIFIILAAASLFMMIPFIYSIVQSIKPMTELFIFPPRLYVTNPTGENYRQLFLIVNNLWVPFERYLFNSVFISFVGTFVYVIIASMAAYSLSFGEFRGKKAMNEIVVSALLFTGPVIAVAQYVVMAKTSMLNTYWALLLPALSAPLGLFLMKQFMQQMVPYAVLEASRIDGAGNFRIHWVIIMPMIKPAWITLIILTFQSLWNGTGTSNYIYSESLKTLPTVLGQIANSGFARSGIGSAAAVLLMILPIVTFIFMQSNVLETMSASGIKE